jgi:hypothetical protein
LSKEVQILYKYRQLDDNSLDAVEKNCLWYSKPSGLNDPHDVAPRWKKDISDKEVLEEFVMLRENNESSEGKGIANFAQKLLSKGWSYTRVLRKVDALFLKIDGKTQRELLQDTLYYNETVFAGMGVLSLSEDPKNSVMWGSYSDSHRGFCLGFEYHETNVLGQYSNNVNYLDTMPKPSAKLFAHDAGNDALYQIAYSKSKDWAYEKEWRVLKQEGNKLYPYPGRLVEVILGMNISEHDEIKLKNAVDNSGYLPRFLKLKKIEDEYGYDLIPL